MFDVSHSFSTSRHSRREPRHKTETSPLGVGCYSREQKEGQRDLKRYSITKTSRPRSLMEIEGDGDGYS